LVTARSAAAVKVVVTLEALFAGAGSAVVVLTFAVLVMVPVAVAATLNTKLNVAEAAGASTAIVQVIVPVAPTAGVEQVNAGPLVWFAETNVVLAGTASVSETFAPAEGPLFVTVTV